MESKDSGTRSYRFSRITLGSPNATRLFLRGPPQMSTSLSLPIPFTDPPSEIRMTKPNNSKVGAMSAKMEVIEIESDTEEVGGRILALCNEVNTSRELLNVLDEDSEAKGATSMQIVCFNDDYESDLNCVWSI